MTAYPSADELFFTRAGLDRARVEGIVAEALAGADDGELFLEYRQSESFAFDDGKLKNASFDTTQGFGLRAVSGEATGYAHASELSEAAMRRAARTVQAVRAGHGGAAGAGPARTNQAFYDDANPLNEVDFAAKVKLLADIDAYARGRDPRVRQVMVSLLGEWQAVEIVRADGARVGDVRPLVRLNVNVVVADGERMESGSDGAGGRGAYHAYFEPEHWRAQVDEALRQALVNLESVPAPAGEMQ
ncbi:MAG: metalloprotease TldD, partial [Proteobacteria bacterium]|nr:metalloprotease TldD [Pseudomonadota bacterium]